MNAPDVLLCFELYQRPTGSIADEVVEIVRSLVGKWFTDDVPEGTGRDLGFHDLLCLRRGGVMVSFIMFTSLDGAIHVSLLGTRPEHQGQGYASMLMRRMFEHARRMGYSRVVALTVPPDVKEAYAPTVRFYQKHGFEVTARYSDLWQSGAIELVATL